MSTVAVPTIGLTHYERAALADLTLTTVTAYTFILTDRECREIEAILRRDRDRSFQPPVLF